MNLSPGAGILAFALLPVLYWIILVCMAAIDLAMLWSRMMRPWHWLLSRVYGVGLGFMAYAFLFRPVNWSFTPDDGFLYWVTHPYHEGAGALFAWSRPEPLSAADQFMMVLDNYWRIAVNMLMLTGKIVLPLLALVLAEFLMLRVIAAVLRIGPSLSAFEEFWAEDAPDGSFKRPKILMDERRRGLG